MQPNETRELLQVFFAAHLSHAVASMAEMGLPDLIATDQSRDVSELARETGTDERTLYRVLRFMSSHGIFAEESGKRFRHSELSQALRTDAEQSFHPAARLSHRLLRSLTKFDETLRTGESALAHSVGKPLFEFLTENPEEAALFDQAMPSFHAGETEAMLDAYDFSGIGTLADIGGGGGSLLAVTLQRHPTLQGILFDLGHVIGRAKENMAAAGVVDRCRLIEGSFFDSIPAGADAYLMRHIIHDWTDEQSIAILENCRKVIKKDGRVLLVEAVVAEDDEPSQAKEMDISMLLYPGGAERTAREYDALFEKSGFRLEGVTPTKSMVSVVEGRPV